MKALACCWILISLGGFSALAARNEGEFSVTETADQFVIRTSALDAVVRKTGYVTGVSSGTFLDRKTGFRDAGYGLDIVDWIMEPGSDEAYRDQLPGDLAYQFNNLYHGKTPKRSIEGPQICTQAKQLEPEIIRGKDFVAVRLKFRFTQPAKGLKAGSLWQQTLEIGRASCRERV